MKQESGFDLAKALSFLLAFVAFSMVIGVGFLVPTIRSIKQKTGMMEIETRSYNGVKSKFDEEEAKLNNLKKTNEAALKALNTSFDLNKFNKDTQTKYQTIIQQVDSSTEGDYSSEKYNISMNFQDPKTMFEFFDNLDKLGSLLKIQTPIVIGTLTNGQISTNYYLNATTATFWRKKETNSVAHK